MPANRVPSARYSNHAETDLLEIASYTAKVWGVARATNYLHELRDCGRMLAVNPLSGGAYDAVWLGLRRFEVGRHVILYHGTNRGVLIVRILHQQALPYRDPGTR